MLTLLPVRLLTESDSVDKFVYKFYTKFVMQMPIIKSISDIRKSAMAIFEQVYKKNKVILVTRNNNKLSVILSPKYFESLTEENESLWEELEMARSKLATKGEKSYKLKDVLSGKI